MQQKLEEVEAEIARKSLMEYTEEEARIDLEERMKAVGEEELERQLSHAKRKLKDRETELDVQSTIKKRQKRHL